MRLTSGTTGITKLFTWSLLQKELRSIIQDQIMLQGNVLELSIYLIVLFILKDGKSCYGNQK